MSLPIRLIDHCRARRYAFTWTAGNIVFLRAGFHFQARAIAAANDLCAELGMTAKFVR